MNRFRFVLAVALFFSFSFDAAHAQSGEPSSSTSQTPTLTSRSNLVLVPALVKKGGKPVFSLTADDFILTDNGVTQPVRVETYTNSQPLALVIIVETGSHGAWHLPHYRSIGELLNMVVGGGPHRVAVVSFDSTPHLVQDFTTNTGAAVWTMATLQEGDPGAAILDALKLGIDLLRTQPPDYRRAVLLLSETVDSGSQISLENAVRAVEDTNTSIYSFGFSTMAAEVSHEGAKLPATGGSDYSNQAYAPGGCMSRNPNADPDAHGNRGVQALDCAEDLLPPLRLARVAFLTARDGLKRNVPKSVAQLTGGEYFTFKDRPTLARHLLTIANDVPNYYVLSFRPQSPHSGPHVLEVKVKHKPEYEVRARKGYWVDGGTNTNQK